ncbi:MAG: rod shape-determining protein MreD, partial [Gammaproteobacteria bacterium]
LVVLYWVMVVPDRINVGVAWLVGLLLDGLNGSLLGEHALALTVVAFLMSRWHRQIKNFPFWQSAVAVGFLIAVYKVLIWVIQGVIGQQPSTLAYLFPILTSMLLWPWVQALLTVRMARVSLRTP